MKLHQISVPHKVKIIFSNSKTNQIKIQTFSTVLLNKLCFLMQPLGTKIKICFLIFRICYPVIHVVDSLSKNKREKYKLPLLRFQMPLGLLMIFMSICQIGVLLVIYLSVQVKNNINYNAKYTKKKFFKKKKNDYKYIHKIAKKI